MNWADSHAHIFARGYGGDKSYGAECADYEKLRVQHAIERTLVVGYEGEPRFSGNNAYIGALAREHDWMSPLYYLDPAFPLAPEMAQVVLDSGFVGFSLYLGTEGGLIDAFDSRLWDVLDERAAILSVNVMPRGLAGAETMIRRRENGVTLLSHLGLPGSPTGNIREWPAASSEDVGQTLASDQITLEVARTRLAPLLRLADCPTVMVKLSGLYAIDPHRSHPAAAPYATSILKSYGAQRMLWGSDFAPGLDVLSPDELFAVPEWFTTTVDEAELALIMHGNLHRILQLETGE
jgi:L-fuconolactonase